MIIETFLMHANTKIRILAMRRLIAESCDGNCSLIDCATRIKILRSSQFASQELAFVF